MPFAATLDTLTDRDLFGIVPYETFTRGRESFRAGLVRQVLRENGHLAAEVHDHRIKVTASDARCTCGANQPCAHVVAALLRWIEMRGSPRAADWAWRNHFASGPAELSVDLDGAGPGLRAELAGSARKATLAIPPEEAADWLTEARSRDGAKFTPRLAAVRIFQNPLMPTVDADFDAAGRLVLRAAYTHKMRDFTPEEVGRGRVSRKWFWDGRDFYPIQDGEVADRTIEGDAVAEFLEDEVQKLSERVVFRASPAVKAARVLPPPALCGIRVKAEGGWLALDPSYRSGEHVLALREILGAQGKFVRRGNDFVRLGTVQRVEPRMDRAGLIRMQQELDVPVEAPPDLGLLEPVGPAPAPPGLQCSLRPYQKAGVDWLWFLHRNGIGGVLADDMGLGKTVQAMAHLLNVYAAGATRPTLVVCPTSVLDHWVEKVALFAPGLRTLRYYGRSRKALLRVAGEAKLVVTTYALLTSDIEELGRIEWECAILDEAQRIKNMGTRSHRAARKLRARSRLALTGTPIENYVDELRSIFEFVLPGYLKEEHLLDLPRLKRLIAPFKLRRLKSEVLQELPPKIEDVRTCEMTPHQAALYRTLVDRRAREILKSLESGPVDYVPIFALLGKLKRLCDHPALVVEGSRSLSSGKFDLFQEILDEALASDQKVVVFTQYLEMMDLIEAELRRRGTGFVDLRGSTANRAETLRRFREDPACRVFVCSLLAGGVGIDLTAASVVIHYDRWWNAAREEQATDRVHRLGQRRGVQVFKLVTRGTLEEKIDRMIRAKRELMDSVVESDAALFRCLGRDELAELLRG